MTRETSPKARIRAAFNQAWDYDAQAAIQARAAQSLAAMAVAHGLAQGPSVLDMGCGTGSVALALRAHVHTGTYLCADLCRAMLQRARTNLWQASSGVLYAAMDAENPALAGTFDLVISNMALQWTTNPAGAMAGLWSLVRAGGLLALSLPGPETFGEWRQAHQGLGLACGLWEYPGLEALGAMLPAGATIKEERHSVSFRRAIDFPRHLKSLGGFIPCLGHTPLSPAMFQAVLAQLDATFPNGPQLTYQIFYALVSKPKQG